MNKSFIYAGVGVVAVAAIAGVAFYTNKSDTPNNGYPAASSQMSMKELLAKGGSQKCTFSSNEGGVESSGTVYMSGGNMRGDFSSKVSGQTVESHMIVEDGTAYVWSGMMAQGMKMNFSAMNAPSGQPSGSFDMDQRIGYDCDPWSADKSKFARPTGMTFMELNIPASGN